MANKGDYGLGTFSPVTEEPSIGDDRRMVLTPSFEVLHIASLERLALVHEVTKNFGKTNFTEQVHARGMKYSAQLQDRKSRSALERKLIAHAKSY